MTKSSPVADISVVVDRKVGSFSSGTEDDIKKLLDDTSKKLSELINEAVSNQLQKQDVDGQEVAIKWTIGVSGGTTSTGVQTVTGTVSVTFG